MEQATNLFAQGLQMDTHPMVQGNNTLSDCLNGTLVTMNGNEVILLNDMGNRRIDNAYLPSGYEPVGIKEYGGVIYIAAYNPITNHSLIGSFPSPERKIDINDNLSLRNSFDFDKFFSKSNLIEDKELLNIKEDEAKFLVLNNDSYLIPLTGETKLHIGDKFVVYSEGLSEMETDITNYNNWIDDPIFQYGDWEECDYEIYEDIKYADLKKIEYDENNQPIYFRRNGIIIGYNNDKVYSPKNRKYTLQIGVLNELNNFNDITQYLVRWQYKDDRWQIIRNINNKSDSFKFNTGYFIPDGFDNKSDIDGNTITDTNLIKSRKKIAANTYSYKLTGPLYMKVSYNHVSNFGYTINGRQTDEGVELTYTGYFTYNCPDGIKDCRRINDSDYYSDGLPADKVPLDLTEHIDFDLYSTITKQQIDESTKVYSNLTYNKVTNEYKVQLVKKYIINDSLIEDNYFKFVIGVNAGNTYDYIVKDVEGNDINMSDPVYIKGLSSKGEINLSLLNSGELSLTGYKFYNITEQSTGSILLNFSSYPKNDESFENLTLTFTDISEQDAQTHYLHTRQPILNGLQIINFDWNKSFVDENGGELSSRKTYKVEIYYTLNNDRYKELENKSELTEEEQEELNNLKNTKYEEVVERWYLSTELFNDLYTSDISDFCTTNDEKFTNKLEIKPDIDNINALYEIKYDEVVMPTLLYRTSNTAQTDNFTITQRVNFIKRESTLELNLDKYPSYLGDYIDLDITGNDTYKDMSVTINKIYYELLSKIYYPLRTVAQLKNRIQISFAGYVYSNDESGTSGDFGIIHLMYKKSYFEKNLPEGGGTHPEEYDPRSDGFTVGWTEEHGHDSDFYKDVINFESLSFTKEFLDYEGLYFPAVFSLGHGGSDVSEGDCSYLGGPFYCVLRNTGDDFIFVKTDPSISLQNKLINWNELETSDPMYKIIGEDPTLNFYTENLNYSIKLTPTIDILSLPTIGTLIFTINTKNIPFELSVSYHNRDIVESYRYYKIKNTDKWINMNNGEKILNTSEILEAYPFKIYNYNTIRYTTGGTYGTLVHCKDDDGGGRARIKGYYDKY